jgi:polysaccharide lyase-like protein
VRPRSHGRVARRMFVLCLGALLLGVAGCSGAPGGPPPVPGASATEQVDPGNLAKFFGRGLTVSDRGSFGFDRGQLISTTDAPGGTMLRVAYPKGSASQRADGEDGGLQAYLPLPDGPRDELYLQYFVRFQPDFDFVKGGKLPGLYGGSVTSGQVIPDGTNGFSTRYMWRGGGDGEVYAYLPTSEDHGTSLGRGCWYFPANQWVGIEQRVKLNTPGASDGEVTVWQDGRQVLHQRGLTYRTTDQLKIDGLFFSTFFGGGDESWASPVDQYADFAGFSISDAFIPPPAGGPAVDPQADPTDNGDNCQATSVPAPS